MEFYDNYITRLETEGNGPELLAELRQEAIRSLQADPPEQALTLTGQMVSALLLVAKRQNPPEPLMVDTINAITDMMADYINKLGWKTRAYMAGSMNLRRYNCELKEMLLKALSSILLFCTHF